MNILSLNYLHFIPLFQVKIGLQLYQVDVDRSYLLDFTSLAPEPEDEEIPQVAVTTTTTTQELLPPARNSGKSKSPAAPNENVHNVMEFFEMCSDLIVALAC